MDYMRLVCPENVYLEYLKKIHSEYSVAFSIVFIWLIFVMSKDVGIVQ